MSTYRDAIADDAELRVEQDEHGLMLNLYADDFEGLGVYLSPAQTRSLAYELLGYTETGEINVGAVDWLGGVEV